MPFSKVSSYHAYVKALCSCNPSLINLDQFLSQPKRQYAYRMCAMDFMLGKSEPVIRKDLVISRLSEEIQEQETNLDGGKKIYPGMSSISSNATGLQGRILIIEDLSKEIVEILGTLLKIDPLFFALHLHTTQRTSSHHQTPDEATLPSRLLTQSYANISYHRVMISDQGAPEHGRYLRSTTIDRKLVFLRSTNIALAQHCASVMRIKNRTGPWLGRSPLSL